MRKTDFVSKKNYYSIFILHYFVKVFFYVTKPFKRKNGQLAKRILVIELGHLGDILTSTNAIENIKKKYPQHEIVCICTVSGAAGLENNPYIYKVIAIDTPVWYETNKRKSFLKVIRSFHEFVKIIRREKVTIAINFRNTSYHIDHIAVWAAGITTRIGFGHKGLDYLLSFSYVPNKGLLNIPIQKMEFINEWLQLPASNKVENHPSFFPIPSSQTKLRALLTLKGIEPNNNRIIAVNIGAQHSFWWPNNQFIELCILLNKQYPDFKILFVGQSIHIELVNNIRNALPFTSFSVVGETDLSMLYYLLKHVNLLITIDTGIRHIANAADTPLVVLRHGADGSDSFGKYINSEELLIHEVPCSPCGQKTCPLNTIDCMKGISVNQVFAAINAKLIISQ